MSDRIDATLTFADLYDTLKGIRSYVAAARDTLDTSGRSYLGNNLMALSNQAIDQLLRAEVVVEESTSSLTDVDVEGLYHMEDGKA